jgi:hypothetical protein
MSPSTNASPEDSNWTEFVLATDIIILSSVSTRINWYSSPLICHKYKGRQHNQLSIWLREHEWNSTWLIFIFDINFRDQPRKWYIAPADDSLHMPWRITDAWDATRLDIPLTDGKRSLVAVGPDESDTWNGDRAFKILISMYTIDQTPSLPHMSTFEDDDEAEHYYFGKSKLYWGSTFETPITYAKNTLDGVPRLNSFQFEEQSGTAVISMDNGDIWVLRYGHP